MKIKNKLAFGILLLVVVALVSLAFAEAQSFSPTTMPSSFTGVAGSASYISRQTYQPSFQTYYTPSDIDTYWPILKDSNQCEGRQDLVLQVAPAGCQPQVVRSDLLAEQNVPVFCQIDALELNPFSDVKNIKNIRFSGQYPKDISAVGFHPARAALRTRDQLLGSPLINNIGYVVVVLKKNSVEKTLPDFVNVTLSGQVEYDTTNTPGIGRTEFLLKQVSDQEWKDTEKNRQSFWQGRYSVRLEDVDETRALVAIYQGDKKLSSTQVKLGETSKEIYVPGAYCKAGMQIAYDGFTAAQDTARLQVGDASGTDTIDVYRGSRFLNDKCYVADLKINPDGETGSVELRCGSGSLGSERILLEIKSFVTSIFVDDFGRVVQPVTDVSGNLNPTIDFGTGIKNVPDIVKGRGKYGLDQYDNLQLVSSGGVDINIEYTLIKDSNVVSWLNDLKNALIEFKNKKVSPDKKPQVLKNKELTDQEAQRSYDDAITEYERVVQDYPAEKPKPSENLEGDQNRPYGEQALDAAIKLAQSFGKSADEARLINELIDKYPNSDLIGGYTIELNRLYTVDSNLAGNVIYLDNQYRTIRLVSLSTPKIKSSADFILGSQRVPLTLNGIAYSVNRYYINLTSLTTTSATISTNCDIQYSGTQYSGTQYPGTTLNAQPAVTKWGTVTLYLDERYGSRSANICGQSFSLDRINLEQVARVRLLPKVQGTTANINMTVKIGIEKRLIQLSPEKTKERIDNLNASIAKFEKISENLANLVKTLKTACFATNAVLTVKNFLAGFSGEALARQRAMQGEHGWNAQCADLVSSGRAGSSGKVYTTLNACFVGEADKINSDVGIIKDCINGVNKNIKEIESRPENQMQSSGLFGGSNVNRNSAAPQYAATLADKLKDAEDITDKNGKVLASLKDPNDALYKSLKNSSAYENSLYNYDQLRDLQLNLDCRNKLSEESRKNVDADLLRIYNQVNDNSKRFDDYKKDLAARNNGQPMPFTTQISSTITAEVVDIRNRPKEIAFTDKDVTQYAIFRAEPIPLKPNESPPFQFGVYYIGLKRADEGKFTPIEIRDAKGGSIADIDKFRGVFGIGTITSTTQVTYFNRFDNPQVKYYENEPYKGMPALVPFDIQRGWYAATKQTLPVFGGQGAFEASGKVSSFWLCNVGSNHKAQFFEGIGDDKCEQVNLNTGQPYNVFSGLSSTEAKQLVDAGVQAIQQAAEQYGTGKGPVRISTTFGTSTIPRGPPSANIPAVQCQNFMSPKDCQLMFNVCDPVICPASRCDFGGQYPVADVIQTGIVGSALLCLPNYREGIYVPVCLTGIQAGIDSYVSILKAHRDCLQENLNSGQMVGICDEIYSIYACEFFWRQIGPVANTLLPKLAEALFGQGGGRGGGEYLTVNAAFDNARKSVDYFTQVYAVNSLKAFKARSVEEAGTEVCKAWVSAKAPTAFKNLVEPDSPTQFYAWFSSTPFTTVTVPATGQYKVFYHIFAGKDAGVSYSVYLKSPPESGYYAAAPYVTVATGFITKGQSKDESKDFTAPEGYKELCVRINAEEKCGFKQVSTDFAINQIRDQYVKDESTKKDVTSASTCVSGSPGLGALANPNIQAGAEEAALPQLYNRGVVRICATDNPGSSTDPTRFTDVGFCDDPKIRCWIDKKSVSNAITDNNLGVKNETLTQLQQIDIANLKTNVKVIDTDALAKSEFDVLEGNKIKILELLGVKTAPSEIRIQANSLLTKIDDLASRLFLNNLKARLSLLKADVKAIVARAYLDAKALRGPATAQAAAGGTAPAQTQVGATTQTITSLTLNGNYDSGGGIYGVIETNDPIFTNIYLKSDKIVYVDSQGQGIPIGTIIDNVIQLSSEQGASILDTGSDTKYYDSLNGAKINGNKIVLSQRVTISGAVGAPAQTAAAEVPSTEVTPTAQLAATYTFEDGSLTLSEPYDPRNKIYLLSENKKIGQYPIYIRGSNVFAEDSGWSYFDGDPVGLFVKGNTDRVNINILKNAIQQKSITQETYNLINGIFILSSDKKTLDREPKVIINTK